MEKTIDTFGIMDIYYGSTSGNSKRLAYDFSVEAKSKGFLPRVICLGDFQPDQLMTSNLMFMFLSTYGTGGPTEDSQRFFEWIEQLATKKEPILKHLKYVIFGLGNSNYEFFAGMSKKIRAFLYQLGAEQLHELTTTDAKTQESYKKYEQWKEGLLEGIISRHPQYFQKKTMRLSDIAKLNVHFTMELMKGPIINWEEQALQLPKLSHQMKTYLSTPKLKVLEISQIRKDDPSRSTLFVRIDKGKLPLSPACNIQLYPQNIVEEHKLLGGVRLITTGTVPFPPMPLKQLMQLLNISQSVPKSFLQGVLMSCSDSEKIHKYEQLLKDDEKWKELNLTCQSIIKQFSVPLEQQLNLGINNMRMYTLAGWSENEIHLLVSLFVKDGKLGLTSKFLASRPKEVRIHAIGSSFNLPKETKTPIVMIANGSGMAPFRSIMHYYKHLAQLKQPINPLVFYYGCQRRACDYYFQEEWEECEKLGIIQMRVATSREGENLYVQKLMEKNQEEIKAYLLEKEAVFYICGSEKMGRDVNNVFISIIKKTGVTPYAAMNKIKTMEKAGRIMKEIYG